MKYIAFKNFKKFSEIAPLQFGDITMLVGCNSAGKSNIIRAVGLVAHNIKNLRLPGFGTYGNVFGRLYGQKEFPMPLFSFDGGNYDFAQTGNFERTLHRGASEEIEFSCGLPDRHLMSASECFSRVINRKSYAAVETAFEITLTVIPAEGDEEQKGKEKSFARVSHILIKDNKRAIQYEIDFVKQAMSLSIDGNETTTDLEDYLSQKEGSPSSQTVLGSYMLNLKHCVFPEKEKQMTYTEQEESIDESISHFEYLIGYEKYEYIKAHDVSRRMVYWKEDKNDYNAEVLHEYKAQKITNIAKKFVKDWMKEFKIGTDFKVEETYGVLYECKIAQNGAWIPLSDLGVGANHLFIFLLKMAILFSKNIPEEEDAPNDDESAENTITMSEIKERMFVILEEPEQNLHPDFQSKLADLLLYIYEKRRIKFIVETHSEYLIRRSQVLVAKIAKEDAKKNPFKVNYIPENGMPYDMEYRADGRFNQGFGKGFFDESKRQIIELL